MKKLLLIALLGTMCFVGCNNDDDATYLRPRPQKTNASDPVFTFDSSGKEDVLFQDGVKVAPQKIICNTPYNLGAGHAVVNTDGKYYLVYWHTNPNMLPTGFTQTKYTSAYGGIRYMVVCPVTQAQAIFVCNN